MIDLNLKEGLEFYSQRLNKILDTQLNKIYSTPYGNIINISCKLDYEDEKIFDVEIVFEYGYGSDTSNRRGTIAIPFEEIENYEYIAGMIYSELITLDAKGDTNE